MAEAIVTSNVLHRTFLIKWRSSLGTAFTIDYGERQYLITARHNIKGIKTGDPIEIFHEVNWKLLEVDLVGVGEGPQT